MIVDPDGKCLNEHWAKTGFDLMTGVILPVLLYDPISDKSLAFKETLTHPHAPCVSVVSDLVHVARRRRHSTSYATSWLLAPGPT